MILKDESGKVFTIEAESFVEKSQVSAKSLAIRSIEEAVAFLPKTSESTSFKNAVANLKAATSEGNANQIARYKEALDKLEAQMKRATGVMKISGSDGKTTYINTTANTVTVKTGEYTYITVAAHGHAIVD